VERGRYLVRHVTGCLVCHSPLDANDKTRLQAGMEGAGDVVIPQGPGRVIAPNITPDPDHGIGRWTDDEIARAVREGVSRDGHALFPMMPYRNYLAMTDADLGAIIAYLRSLPPVKQAPGRTELIVPVRYIVRTVPEPLTGAVETHFENEVQRGEYLTRVASCQDCHSTFDDRRRPLPGLDFAGGNLMQEREGTATTANITPDETGIKGYTADTFREMMRTRKRA
jgi:mono/diheme cytochrome c family protein